MVVVVMMGGSLGMWSVVGVGGFVRGGLGEVRLFGDLGCAVARVPGVLGVMLMAAVLLMVDVLSLASSVIVLAYV